MPYKITQEDIIEEIEKRKAIEKTKELRKLEELGDEELKQLLKKVGGFVELALIIGIAIISLGSLFFYTQHNNEKLQKQLLGVAVSSTASSETIGQFRINVNNSLQNLAASIGDATSSDPGHYHTLNNLASVTGSLPLVLGGTSSTSYLANDGILVASGTAGFSNSKLRPANGVLIIGSSTNWTTSTLTAGTNISITNATGSITIANTAVTGMSLLASTTLGVNATSVQVTITSAKKNLMIYGTFGTRSGNSGIYLRFNNTSINSTLYGSRRSNNGGADNLLTTGAYMQVNATSTASSSIIAHVFSDFASTTFGDAGSTWASGQSVYDLASAPSRDIWVGGFVSSTPITEVRFLTFDGGTVTMASGSAIRVYGSND